MVFLCLKNKSTLFCRTYYFLPLLCTIQKPKDMTTYLITSTLGASEWIYSFEMVQKEMNILEKFGIVSNVKVQKFEDNILTKELTYNYNGEEWEK